MFVVNKVNKSFNDIPVLENINFELETGSTLGVIGQNGAGKTTIFRMILDFLKPDSGEIIWNDLNNDFLNKVGYLPEERGLNLKRSIEEQIQFFGKLKGLNEKTISDQMDFWFEQFQVSATKKTKIKALSKGNKQKIQLICSIVHNPKFLILDEPYSGLDPVNASLLNEGIKMLKEQGTTIIFSSHNMENVESICDSLLMLKKGRIVLNGSINEVRNSFGKSNIFVENSFDVKKMLSDIPEISSIEELPDNTLKLKVTDPEVGKDIFNLVTEGGYTPIFKQAPPTLEEIFKIKAGE